MLFVWMEKEVFEISITYVLDINEREIERRLQLENRISIFVSLLCSVGHCGGLGIGFLEETN